MKEKIIKCMASFLIIMLFCTLIARGAASLTVAKVKTDEPGRGTLVRRFQGTGTIVLKDREFQSLPEGQKVARVLVKPGSDIKKGDKLVQLDLDYLDEQIKEKEREIELKQIALKQQKLSGQPQARTSMAAQAKLDLDATKEAFSEAKKREQKVKKAEKTENEKQTGTGGTETAETEERSESNSESNSESAVKEEVEAAKKAYEQAKNAYDLALQEEKNARKNENVSSQISGLEQQSTELELEGMNEQLDKLKEIKKVKGVVKASKEGVLSSIGVSEGMLTTGTEQIVLDCGGLEAQGIIPQEEIGSVSEGDEVSLRIQGETRQTILKIERIGQESSGQSDLGQDVLGQSSSGQSGAGMQALWYSGIEKDSLRSGTTFTYEYSKQSDGSYDCLIPLSALREASGTAYVLIAEIRSGILGENYEAVKVPVAVLGKDQNHAAVEASFPEGALVIAESNKYVKEGDRVRLDE